MTNEKQTRRVSAGKLRNLLSDMTNDICNAQERIAVALSGNTFEIQLHDCSINITINKEGGPREN